MEKKKLSEKILKIIPSEFQEQKALVKWLTFHPMLKKYFCKIDNEGKRTDVQGCNAKKLGLRPGVSDLFIYYPIGGYHGLWLEVKRAMKYPPSARKTPTWIAQELFHEQVKSVGYEAKICYGWEDGKDIIERYISP